MLRRQLGDLAQRMDSAGVHLGLDLAVGVHPLGYDVWSRPDLFALDMSVGAPPDAGFPSGQSWGFPPVRPDRSREEHHAYLAAGVAHQAALADVLRVDHIMAMHRLYWIPAGMDRAEGTYVHYPSEELFAVLCLESHRNQCELIGENLGTVPAEIDEALPRHRIGGMYVAEFAAAESDPPRAPEGDVVAMIDTHDTPTFAGWLAGLDIDERVRLALLKPEAAEGERQQRDTARRRMTHELGGEVDDPEHLLALLIEWLGGSDSPLVMIWLEDLWLEREPVNVPGSTSTQRPNWQRPMKRSLEQVMTDQSVAAHLTLLDTARRGRAGLRRTETG
jgi:4-alpha-glucanotransferase